MVRAPCIDQNGMKKGAWSEEEDNKLRAYVRRYGHWNWRQLPKFAGLNRCGKSCRLRWLNYLKPGVRRGNYTPQEEELILELHGKHGSKWSVIAAQLPGRVDNDIKNHWHSHLRGKMNLQQPLSPKPTADDGCSSMPINDQGSDSFSVSTLHSEQMRIDQDQTKNDDAEANNNEVSSTSYAAAAANQFDQDSRSFLSMDPFWNQPIATSDYHEHWQLPAFLEDPFTYDMEYFWLHELMQNS